MIKDIWKAARSAYWHFKRELRRRRAKPRKTTQQE